MDLQKEFEEAMASHTKEWEVAFRTTPGRERTMEHKYSIPTSKIKYSIDPDYNYSADNFIIGGIYVLPGTKCEWGRMPGKEYILKYVIKEIGGVDVDIVIMKQIKGKEGTIFCLSKSDCENLGIEYEDKLQVFSKDMEFKFKRGQKINFKPSDLSTYPINKKTLKISNIHLLMDIGNPFIEQRHNLIIITNDILRNGNQINVETQHTGTFSSYAQDEHHETYKLDVSFSLPFEKNELSGKGIDDIIFLYYNKKDLEFFQREIYQHVQTPIVDEIVHKAITRATQSVDEAMSRVDEQMKSISDSMYRENRQVWNQMSFKMMRDGTIEFSNRTFDDMKEIF